MLMFKERHIQPCSSHSRMAPASCSSAVEEDGGQAAAQVGLSLNHLSKKGRREYDQRLHRAQN